ncbi:MaoC family dehydratase [Thalassomonas sp. M1454]|uniref:MaoC family dehydratase n=1 Tax=Thalassomonas sp. M1454 TaxID=2594477 RepID=UPI00117BF99E|nr:MaoC family dehydratase [Thalassomonas sp. M1454]TRX54971.1 MaoC family dehydratase [Thalassomonas sp. M1454]
MQNNNYLPTPTGLFFDDFIIGQKLVHGVPRTITEADATLYTALTGSRFALHCATTVANSAGFSAMPVDNFLLFHIAFGKTVNDVSLNAVANLGYAEIKFAQPCFAGDTISVSSEVIGLKENSNGKTGVVYVHSTATNQHNEIVLSFKRWVMVHKQAGVAATNINQLQSLQAEVVTAEQVIPSALNLAQWQDSFSDNQRKASDFNVGDSLFHRDGITINDSDHSLATRLYQNNARVHFDQHMMDDSKHGKRLVYGGHIISLCRALSYNGLGNAIWLSAIHGGSHCNPSFAGDTIYSQSTIKEISDVEGKDDLAIVRIEMLGIKNNNPDNMDYLYQQDGKRKKYHSDVVLDLDYSVLMRK